MTPYEMARGTLGLLDAGHVHAYATTTLRMVDVVAGFLQGRAPEVRRMEEPLLLGYLPGACCFASGPYKNRRAILDDRHRPAVTYGYNLWMFFYWEDPATSLRPLEVLEALGPAVVEVAIELQAPGLDVVDVTQMAEAAMGAVPFDWRLP